MDISVIMPVYNVEEEYFRECLESLLGQTKKDGIEAILIDDGSTNGCGAVADEYAEKYDQIRVWHTENRGAGPARNTAIGYATGKYLAFLDADDLLPEDTLEKMFDRAEHDGSEVVVINTVRFDTDEESQASIHKTSFRNLENVTNAKESPDLIYDTISCNKLIRRDYWEKNGISYPPTSLYEDIPVMTRVLLRAEKVSVIRSIGYKWRFRELESRSTTQKREQLENLQARLRILRQLDDIFKEDVTDERLILEKQMKALRVDLKIYVNVCPDLPPERAREFMREMNAYLRECVSEEAMDRLNPIDRKIYEAMLDEDLETFIKRIVFRTENYKKCPNIERDGRMFMRMPEDLFGAAEMDNTESLSYRYPAVYLQNVEEDKKRIRFTCQLYFPRLSVATPDMQEIKATLCDEHTGEETELPVTFFNNHALTEKKGRLTDEFTGETVEYNYDGTGFYVDLYPGKAEHSIRNGVIVLRYRNRFIEGSILLQKMTGKTKNKLESISFSKSGTSCRLTAGEMKVLKVNIERTRSSLFGSLFK